MRKHAPESRKRRRPSGTAWHRGQTDACSSTPRGVAGGPARLGPAPVSESPGEALAEADRGRPLPPDQTDVRLGPGSATRDVLLLHLQADVHAPDAVWVLKRWHKLLDRDLGRADGGHAQGGLRPLRQGVGPALPGAALGGGGSTPGRQRSSNPEHEEAVQTGEEGDGQARKEPPRGASPFRFAPPSLDQACMPPRAGSWTKVRGRRNFYGAGARVVVDDDRGFTRLTPFRQTNLGCPLFRSAWLPRTRVGQAGKPDAESQAEMPDLLPARKNLKVPATPSSAPRPPRRLAGLCWAAPSWAPLREHPPPECGQAMSATRPAAALDLQG